MKHILESGFNELTVEEVMERVPFVQELDKDGIASVFVEDGKIYVEV